MSISERYETVKERMHRAADRSDRAIDEITLIAVTKTWPAEIVVAASEAGMQHFGENRAEELSEKRQEVEAQLGDTRVFWHAIGALQSRKTNMVADAAHVFHALDRSKIAHRLSRRLEENGRSVMEPLPFFLEVNVSGEASKAGINCEHWETDGSQREKLLTLAKLTNQLPGLKSQGLMTMAPWQADDGEIRQVFERTRELSHWLQQMLPDEEWSFLSMGMTDDFEIAIEEGATHIRVGRAIFGERE